MAFNYFGLDFDQERIAILKKIGYASGYDKLPARLTVIENLEVVGRIYGMPKLVRTQQIERLLKTFKFWFFGCLGCNIMIFSFAEELWSNNIINMFSLLFRITEWICGIMLFYGIMMGITSVFCMLAIFALYNVPFWHMTFSFLVFAPPLVFSAIWIGFTCLQIIVTLGRRGVEIGYVFAWMLLPFSGAYYPTEILPAWGQAISKCLPMSYVFEAMRAYITIGQDPTSLLIKAYALSILYATCSVAIFIYCFNRSKQNGLARLAD